MWPACLSQQLLACRSPRTECKEGRQSSGAAAQHRVTGLHSPAADVAIQLVPGAQHCICTSNGFTTSSSGSTDKQLLQSCSVRDETICR